MSRTIGEVPIRRHHRADHDRLRSHLGDFLDACSVARRLKTLGGPTPFELVCETWNSEPQRFRSTSPTKCRD